MADPTTTPRSRDRSRPHDIVLWGATGFTGQLVAEYLTRHHLGDAHDPPLRLALAGRNRKKLERVRADLARIRPEAAELPLLVGDSFDAASLDAIAEQASVVCTTVGPYAKYGAELVAACVRHGTDYCDLTGETQFIRRMIDAHQDEAVRTGARIVHCCGFDSIPSDLGTLMLQEEAKERYGAPLREVKFFAGESKGGFSGGTVASMLNLLEEAERDPHVRKVMGHPYALNPDGERRGPDGSDQKGVRYDDDLGMWTAPFIMAAINTRVVRRSNALMGYAYGKDFRYSEVMSTGKGPAGLARAAAVTAGMGGFVAGVAIKPIRKILEDRVLPAPGEGPDAEAREEGFFVVRLLGEMADGRKVRGRVEGDHDPGYGETALMLGESAVCLALEGAELDAPGGIRTPASTMGATLIQRLRRAGMVFRIEG